ncbi:MAG: IS66 family transposase [Prevotellaceae bacterium]|nr:IS66 family transposase [Prevotellaceae bacterium]
MNKEKYIYFYVVKAIITIRREVMQQGNEPDELLSVNAAKCHAGEQALIDRLIKHRHSIPTFLYFQNVPPDNNAMERAVWNMKLKTEVSGILINLLT